ncbi:MAG: DUF5317 family protein [Actinomycetota bacterium]
MAFAPLVLAIVIGTVVGFARRGRLTALAGVRVASPLLFAVAVVCGLAVDRFDLPAPAWIAVAGLAAALAFTLRNLRLVGMAVVSVGIIANLVPIALNGATPVRADALVDAGMIDAADVDRVMLTGPRELSDADTMVSFLGDTIPLSFADQVVSFGDLIILVGLADVVANLMTRRRRRRVPASALASLEAFGWHETEEQLGSVIDLRTELRPLYPEDEGEVVRVFASTSASPAQDCGIAPPPAAESPSQYSAYPERTAPAIVRPRSSSPTSVSAGPRPKAFQSR